MKKIRVDKVFAYHVGFDANILLLNTVYDIEDKVRVAYVYNNSIIGNITHKKVYYTNRGGYIIYFNRRIYLDEFYPADFYGEEFVGGRK